MAQPKSDEDLKIAMKLSDAKESFKWYSLQIPELTNLQPRVGHALVSLTDGKVLMIGGGNHNGALNEVVSINLQPDSKNDKVVAQHPASQCFPARYEFLCAKDVNKNCAWIFGGADTEKTSNEIIKIDEDTIETLKHLEQPNEGLLPCPRTQGNNSALIEYQGKPCIAVFAGGLKGEQPVQDQDLYLFDTVEGKWQKITVQVEKSKENLPFACRPPLVQGHVMTAIGSKILLHGGINSTCLYDGFHWMDFKTENEDSSFSWTSSGQADVCSDKPSGRAAHGIARISDADKHSPLLYMFGGIGENGACNDLWSFNADSMSWTQVTKNLGTRSSSFHPVPRLDFAMSAIGLHSESETSRSVYIMIHGGMNREGEIFNDAWVMRVQ